MFSHQPSLNPSVPTTATLGEQSIPQAEHIEILEPKASKHRRVFFLDIGVTPERVRRPPKTHMNTPI